MGLFSWMKDLFGASSMQMLAREKTVHVDFDEACLRTDYVASEANEIAWDSVSSIFILTTTTGPAAADFFWCFASHSEKVILSFPSEAKGVNLLLSELEARFEGFDFKAFTEAAGSTEEGVFPLWGPLPEAE